MNQIDHKKLAELAFKYSIASNDKIEADFKKRAEELNVLLAKDHGLIGLVLKVHLIVEYYLNKCLKRNYPNSNIANTSFSKKVSLIPQSEIGIQWLLPGIKELNKIRNQFAHIIETEVHFDDFQEIKKIVKVSRRDISHNDIAKLLHGFASISGAFLDNPDPEIQILFSKALKRAFEEIKNNETQQ